MTISILIVDDADMDRYLLKRFLQKTSIESIVTEVSDGESAIEFFNSYKTRREKDPERYPPLLIFLDINMPKVNGFQFLEEFARIRDEQALESTVVVMFTSSPRAEDREQAFHWDFVKDFIVKGDFTSETLGEVIVNTVGPARIAG